MRRIRPLALCAGVIGRSQIGHRLWTMALAVVCGFHLVYAAAPALNQKSPAKLLPTLTTAHEVHSLTPQDAAQQHQVRLRAVVTYYDPYIDARHAALFVHDATGCIFVSLPALPVLPLTAGTLVEVTGVSGSGDYAPIVQHAQVRVLGQSHLPPAAP